MTELQRLEPSLATLFDCWRIFLAHPNLDDLGQHLLESVAQITHASRASLMLWDEGEQVVVIKAAVGPAPEIVSGVRPRLGEEIAAWVAQNHCPLLLPDGPNPSAGFIPAPPEAGAQSARQGHGQALPAAIHEALRRDEITSALVVPLEVEGHVLGVLNLTRLGASDSFTLRDLWFVSPIAERMATALHMAHLYTQRESRERFISRILESIPSSLVVIDRALRIVSVNRNFLDKARREERNTLNRKIADVFPQVLVEYTQLEQKIYEVFRSGRAVEGGKVAYRAPGVPSRIYFYRLFPLKGETTTENVMLLLDDITEREQLGEEVRRAERHLASVVECANDLVISLDPSSHILTWNQAAEITSGFKAEQVKGRSLLALCPAEQQPLMAKILRGLAGRERFQNIEVYLLTDHGQQVPIAWSFSSMRDDSGGMVGIVAVGRDLTERRRLETQLIQSAKMASLGVMAGGIAHELRNPLGIIAASNQLLAEQPNDAELRSQCVQKINVATQRASLIIENLLKFARPQGDRLREVDLHSILEDTFALMVHQLNLQKVNLLNALEPNLPRVNGNAELLQQVFINLILNACNAMPQGGTLSVSTRAIGTERVEVRFSDTGHGIPAEDLPKIFDPFFTTMPVGKGTGLGLSLSYSIIQQHQGQIEVESELGKGAAFVIRLPIAV